MWCGPGDERAGCGAAVLVLGSHSCENLPERGGDFSMLTDCFKPRTQISALELATPCMLPGSVAVVLSPLRVRANSVVTRR